MLQIASSLIFVVLGLASGALAFLAPFKEYSGKIVKYFPRFIAVLASLSIALAASKYIDARKDRSAKANLENTTTVEKSPGADIAYSPFRDITSALSLSSPASGIDCSQVRKTGPGTWNVIGTIRVGGVTLSRVYGVSNRAFNIGGNDLAALINEKCDIVKLEDIH